MEFYEKVSPSFRTWSGILWDSEINSEWQKPKKYPIPPPTLCPDCRKQRRFSFRNERKLYKRKCAATGKDIVSIYSADKPYTVYHQDYWWSDAWDPLDYGRVFDFSRSFFEQFGKLMEKIPHLALTAAFDSENSEYATYAWRMKDCYMVFASWMMEKTMYSSNMLHATHVMDSVCGTNLDQCYQVLNSEGCFWCIYSINSVNCMNSSFLYNCKNCSDCFMCNNLVWKKYHIENKEYSKEEYSNKMILIRNGSISLWWKVLDRIIESAVHRNLMMMNCENSGGDNLKGCNNCFEAYFLENAQNCKYIENWWMSCNNVYDGLWVWENFDLWYELIDAWLTAVLTCFWITCYTCNYSFYNINCHNSSYLFGCISLRNKSYCIFNKQYTKEEYEELVPRIIEHMMQTGEWGEFFPSSLSPFGYNETVATEYFPLSRKEVLENSPLTKGDVTKWQGDLESAKIPPALPDQARERLFIKGEIFNWSDYEAPFPKVDKIIPANKLPDDISKIPDDILNWAIECEVTGRPFRIIKQELEFYRKHNLPIPRRHPDQRHLDRMTLRNPRKLYERVCDCENCEENHKQRGVLKEEEFDMNTRTGKRAKKMITTYAPERTEMVYCEECYNREVVG